MLFVAASALAAVIGSRAGALVVAVWTVGAHRGAHRVRVAAAGAVTWNTFVGPSEEADLAARLGAPCETYRATVRCWVLKLPSR